MSRVFCREPLEGLATFWRIRRRDGVTLGLTSHDCDLWFDGVRHRAAPGRVRALDDNRAEFEFTTPQPAVTPGQAVVFYDGDVVLGGGWID